MAVINITFVGGGSKGVCVLLYTLQQCARSHCHYYNVSMDVAWIRNYCLSLPHTTEDVQWESLLFRIARKIYLLMSPDGTGPTVLCFKCTPEEFAELIEMEGVIPAPYLARNHWVALTRLDALPRTEIKKRILGSYELVRAKLPKKTQRELSST